MLPVDGFDSGEYVNDVPVIMLTGSTEFSLFATFDGFWNSIEDEDVRNAARSFAVNYGSDFYRTFNTQLSAAKMADVYTSPMYLCQVNYGGSDSASAIPMFGSFHGIFVPMISRTHGYSSFADFSGSGYVAMSSLFNAYLRNFLETGNPNEGSIPIEGWEPWEADSRLTLVLDGDEETGEGSAELLDVFKTNEEIIAEMEADDSIPADVKEAAIFNVMAGRWFSADMDEHFGAPSFW